MTNGEKIKELFPDTKIITQYDNPFGDRFMVFTLNNEHMQVNIEWWNSEYKEPTTRNCFGCKYSKDNHNAGTEECHLCMWENQYTPITKNDLVSSIIEKISEKVTETHEEFIFETIRPYCENVVQMKISKRDLEQALLKYYGKNDLGVASELEKNSKKLEKDFGELDCISRADAIQAMQDKAKKLTNEDTINGLCGAVAILFELPSVTPQEPRCKECKWWKDSDGEYRRGCGAESQCPINRREVFEGNGYCYLFEPQESEET